MAVRSNTQRNENVDLIYGSEAPLEVKRNPYLVAFESQQGGKRQRGPSRLNQEQRGQNRRSQERSQQNYSSRAQQIQSRDWQDEYDEDEYNQDWQDIRRTENAARTGYARRIENSGIARNNRPRIQPEISGRNRKTAPGYESDRTARQQAARRAAQARRRKRVVLQRAMVGIWVFCILVLLGTFLFRNNSVSAGAGDGRNNGASAGKDDSNIQYSGVMVQGLPAEEYAKHPAWTEDFLTPNEYSRPGDALERVDNIFVHYTANPGTSAAQNRSYFEWLKDTHETSASAHFIIGYEGEIIQCIPLDEIAYAVQSRNFDSISIECCYLKEDGSFTQETYDSLISLLAWLRDAYHLETEDILRHYDCGGKKCPLYYTDNPDEWEELKKDVDKL